MVALGCLSEGRGSDSAGVGWLRRDAVPHFLKIAQNPLVAYPVTLRGAIRSAARHGSPLIGHTRQATTGAVTSENAHPFLSDGILYAHNGIIWNHEDFGVFEVDSQALIVGIKARDFSKYEGPIALVWIESGKLHAMRKGNPLYRGKRKKGVYLASDDDYLEAIGCTHIRELAEGFIYTWKDATLEQTKTVAVNRSTSVKSFRGEMGSTTSWPPEHEYAGYHNWRAGKVWDQAQLKWVEEKSILLPEKEADTLAEVDAEENGEADRELCDECKFHKKMIASDFCASCMRRNLGCGG
jgi:hypothetical protein